MKKVTTLILSAIFVFIFSTNAISQELKSVHVITEEYELYAPNDVELKSAKEDLDFASQTFEKYFGEKPPKIAVYVLNKPEDAAKIDFGSFSKRGLSVMPFITNEYIKSLEKGDKKEFKLSDARALSHEAGHKYLIAYVNTKIPTVRSSIFEPKYGHPAIPDWFDEAFATLCEYPALQERRNNFLSKNVEKTISFNEFFKMEHPVFAKTKSSLPKSISKLKNKRVLTKEEFDKLMKNKGAKAKVLTKEEAEKFLEGNKSTASISIKKGDDITTEKDMVFYSQSLSFADYLIMNEGKNVIKKITDGLIEGKSVEDILGRKNIEIESDWKKWIRIKKQ